MLGAFLFGHLLGQAEYNRVAEQLLVSEQEREALDVENRQLAAELSAITHKSFTSDEAIARLQNSLSELRVQRVRLQEELEMFRNLASGGENITGIAIDNVSITASGDDRYQLDLRLIQPRGRKRVAGNLDIRFAGDSAGEAVSFALQELILAGEVSEDFDFRYFEQFSNEIQLPQGFSPVQVEITADPVNPYRSSLKKVQLSVPWEVSQPTNMASLSD